MAGRYAEESGGFGFGSSSGYSTQSSGQTDVTKDLQEITTMNRRFNTMIGKIGSASDSASLRNQIHELQSLFTRKVKSVKTSITPQLKSSEGAVKMQANRCLQSLQEEVGSFEENLKELRQKELRHPASKFAAQHTGDDFSFNMDNSAPAGHDAADSIVAMQQAEASNLDKRQEEHSAMVNLESDMRDLHSMFVDMAALVNDQGEVITTIEDNIQSAEIKVQAAAKDTRKAAEYQSKARRKKICCYVVVGAALVAIIIVIVVVVVTQTKSSSSSGSGTTPPPSG